MLLMISHATYGQNRSVSADDAETALHSMEAVIEHLEARVFLGQAVHFIVPVVLGIKGIKVVLW